MVPWKKPLVPILARLPRAWAQRPHPAAGRRTCPRLLLPSSASACRVKRPPCPQGGQGPPLSKPLPVTSLCLLDRIEFFLTQGLISLLTSLRGAKPPRGRCGAVSASPAIGSLEAKPLFPRPAAVLIAPSNCTLQGGTHSICCSLVLASPGFIHSLTGP